MSAGSIRKRRLPRSFRNHSNNRNRNNRNSNSNNSNSKCDVNVNGNGNGNGNVDFDLNSGHYHPHRNQPNTRHCQRSIATSIATTTTTTTATTTLCGNRANAATTGQAGAKQPPRLQSQSQLQLQLQLQLQFGIFGVDAEHRINLWNESAAGITGIATAGGAATAAAAAAAVGVGALHHNTNSILGTEFRHLFPSSRCVSSPGLQQHNSQQQQQQQQQPPSLVNMLDEVIRTGASIVERIVILTTAASSASASSSSMSARTQKSERVLSVDLLPQFHVDTTTKQRIVSGVVLVCRSTLESLGGDGYISNSNNNSNNNISNNNISNISNISNNNNITSSNSNSSGSGSGSIVPSATPARNDHVWRVSIAEEEGISPKGSTSEETGLCAGSNCKQSLALARTRTRTRTRTIGSVSSPAAGTLATKRTIAKATTTTTPTPREALHNTNEHDGSFIDTDTVDAIVFGVDRCGIINEWNHRISELTGMDRTDALGLPLSDDRVSRIVFASQNTNNNNNTTNNNNKTHTTNNTNNDNNTNTNANANANTNLSLGEELAPFLSEAYRGRSTRLVHLRVHVYCKRKHKRKRGSIPEQNRTKVVCDGTLHTTADTDTDADAAYHSSSGGSIGSIGSSGSSGSDGPSSGYELRHLVASISPRYDLNSQHNSSSSNSNNNNNKKQAIGALVVALDTTECFTNYFTIQSKANELRKLIDTANAPIFGIDARGYVNEWNDKTAEITGYQKEDAFGCLLVDTFISPAIQDSVRCILQDALEHGRGTSNYELEFLTQSKEIRHLLVNITPQCDRNNAVVGVVLIAQDVTEAVQRDRAVANMALELRQLIDTANAPIFGIDVHGTVNEWNTRMSDVTGFAKEEAFRKPLVDTFIATSMREKVWEILEAALAGNETSNYEVEVVSKSGEPAVLLVNATTRRDPDANVIGVVGVAQDVTEDRKHAKALREMQTLRASQEAKVETERNMTAYFAHELRNPLGAIDSALAAMPENLPASATSLVSGMQLCTGFMASIMNNLLDVRKMEEGKMRLGRAPVSIRKILHNVHKMLSPSVRHGVEFEHAVNLPPNDNDNNNDNDNDNNNDYWVLGDAHRIEQVLTNVVSNAIKYTVSGRIRISIEWEENNLKFVCEDTGPGIPTNEQEKLFHRFVQRGGAPGTGLGLAIAKHIVDLVGGSIRFESDPAVKAGTTCIVLMALPLCKAPAPEKNANTMPNNNNNNNNNNKKTEIIEKAISVLVIDDIKMNRKMLARRIKKGIAPNATIREAATGEEALLICGSERFDVMIVDQFMEEAGGVMVGTDVVFAMRRMRIDSVIVGCSGNDIGTQFLYAGADMVWKKPMPSNDQIIRDLRSALSKRNVPEERDRL